MAITTTVQKKVTGPLRWLVSQLAIVAVAVVIAFSIPYAAYLFGHSAPRMSSSSASMLLLTQVMLALSLTLLLAGSRAIWRKRHQAHAAKLADPVTVSNESIRLDGEAEREVILLVRTEDSVRYLEYDSAAEELVYRNAAGAEIRRMSMKQGAQAEMPERRTLRALSEPLSRFVSARVRAMSSSIRISPSSR